jgi:hypothetical protein
MKHLVTHSLLAALISCSSTRREPYHYKRLAAEQTAREAKERAELEAFQRQYAAYEFPGEAVPGFTKLKEITSVQKRMTLVQHKGHRLELRLGARWKDGSGLYRTESRYTITNAAGKVLASVESLMALDDANNDPDNHLSIQIILDKSSPSFLITESQAWSNRRTIVFGFREGTEWAGDEGWIARTVEMPIAGTPPTPVGVLWVGEDGFSDGAVFFRWKDRCYRMPVEKLPEEKTLGYSIG